ncbi:hypothetical protein HPB48_013755 [Haemaphysalis longicornis]|uniref:Uncharacterized protein n=1 Tax=Haemaphysalis longicornis TaxID=44386 RepID=A0A9J6FNL5_HAELO|nr:hypothetical protein HPB48_013755 [Haemaphysalis longicornis]
MSECGTADRLSSPVSTSGRPTISSDNASPEISPQLAEVPGRQASPTASTSAPQAQPASVKATSKLSREGPQLSGEYSHRGYSSWHTYSRESMYVKARRPIVIFVSLFLLFMAIILFGTLLAGFFLDRLPEKPSRQPRYISPTIMGVYGGWAAVSSARQCTGVTGKAFAKNGTIGDAAVATILCVCVAMPHKCGLGGGFMAIYYNRKAQNATSIVVRPRAPGGANENMFGGNPKASLVGAAAVATFGELEGYELLLNVTGSRLKWKDLFEDAILMAEGGIEVYEQLARDIGAVTGDLFTDARMQLWSQNMKFLLSAGGRYSNKNLANTLRKIADSDRKGRFFDSSLEVRAMVEELARAGGILTVEDFAEFRGTAEASIAVTLTHDERLFTTTVPTSGAILAFVVSVLDKFRREGVLPDDELTWHRFVEALKYAFARRFELGDPDGPSDIRLAIERVLMQLMSNTFSEAVAVGFITSEVHSNASAYGLALFSGTDHGSADVCIVAADGDALCLVSTINTPFGSRVYSNATGLWYNNAMHEFSTPYGSRGLKASRNNYIRPGLRPVSSLCPSIVVDADGDVLFAGSSTGGPLAISGLAQVLARSLWMEHTVKEAIDAGRLHNQLFPDNVVRHEGTADRDVLAGLQQRLHMLKTFEWTGSVLAVHRVREGVYAAGYDYRNMAIASSDGMQRVNSSGCDTLVCIPQ